VADLERSNTGRLNRWKRVLKPSGPASRIRRSAGASVGRVPGGTLPTSPDRAADPGGARPK
jgi:hypothetical protein